MPGSPPGLPPSAPEASQPFRLEGHDPALPASSGRVRRDVTVSVVNGPDRIVEPGLAVAVVLIEDRDALDADRGQLLDDLGTTRGTEWEQERIYVLLNVALAHLPDYRPWPREVVFSSLAPFRTIADADLILFAEDGERTVGWLPGIPNLNEALIHANGLRYPGPVLQQSVEAGLWQGCTVFANHPGPADAGRADPGRGLRPRALRGHR